MIPAARPRMHAVVARHTAPRAALLVSDFADAHRQVSSKGSDLVGRWSTDNNPPLREPMDCMSTHSPVHKVVLKFPIQFGKTEIAVNTIGYRMHHAPCPILVCLPDENSQAKWIEQKLQPAIDETPVMKAALTSLAARDGANRRDFKDFKGGQLHIQHGGSPTRLKLLSAMLLIVDEVDQFAQHYKGGDDPLKLLEGRTSAFPSTYKQLFISTPTLTGVSRIDELYEKSDQRRFYVACPHCGEMQPLEWKGLHWNPGYTEVWYACRENGCVIEEHHKTQMIRWGRWVAENPDGEYRGYTINALYYQFDLGPRWLTLAKEWRDAQGDPGKLKTFINDRLAESWEDPAMRSVKFNMVADRAEERDLRPAPSWVCAVTAGTDTQDDRLAVQLLGWGRGMRCWPLDYVELQGDPQEDAVWVALTDLLLRPIEHESGALLRVDAAAIDMQGHRTEDVKNYVRRRLVRRLLCIFGATPNNAPVLGKGKLVDINWRNQHDKAGVHIHAVGTVAIKHLLYGWLAKDHEKKPDERKLGFSKQLPDEYFTGLTGEVYNPTKNRFDKRRGVKRNEPLDTWVYGYAATHHPELRMHRWTKADWDAAEARVRASAGRNVSREDHPHRDRAASTTPEPRPAARPLTKPVRKARWGDGE